MKRLLVPGMLLLFALGCQLPPERAPLQPLPEPGAPVPYSQLITRARAQATQATEAFYVNRWQDLEETAGGLEQTARFLPRAEEVPATLKDLLPVASGDLVKDARKLREAAQAKDVKAANEALQRIHLKIREIRPVSE